MSMIMMYKYRIDSSPRGLLQLGDLLQRPQLSSVSVDPTFNSVTATGSMTWLGLVDIYIIYVKVICEERESNSQN